MDGSGRLRNRVVTQSGRKRAQESRACMVDGRKRPRNTRTNKSDAERLGPEKTPIHQSSDFHPNDLEEVETTVESSDDSDTSISIGTCEAMEKEADRQLHERQVPMNEKRKGQYESSPEEDDEEIEDDIPLTKMNEKRGRLTLRTFIC